MDIRNIIFNLKEAGKIGPRTLLALLEHFGSAEEVWEAKREDLLAVPRIGEKTVTRLVEGRAEQEVTRQQLEGIEEQGIRVITLFDPDYPERLAQWNDAPSLLYVRGQFDFSESPIIAVVGTHEALPESMARAHSWGRRLAERGAVVVSGLARGIDGAAHAGTLEADGRTIGVLGCGFAQIYPPEHSLLAAEMTESGALVSEYVPQTTVTVGRLMARNRIVVGLADAVLIVKVHESSTGSMDAASRAEEQGKPLFVLQEDKIPQLGQLKAHGAVVIDDNDGLDLLLNYL